MFIWVGGSCECEDDAGTSEVWYAVRTEAHVCTDNRRMYKFSSNSRTCSGTSAHKLLYPATYRLETAHKWDRKDASLEVGILPEIWGTQFILATQQSSLTELPSQIVNFSQHKITKKNRFKPSNYKVYYLKWAVESPSSIILVHPFSSFNLLHSLFSSASHFQSVTGFVLYSLFSH